MDEAVETRELPPAAKAAWRSFRRHLKCDADVRGIEVSTVMWNGIRNAWRDGYWAGKNAT